VSQNMILINKKNSNEAIETLRTTKTPVID